MSSIDDFYHTCCGGLFPITEQETSTQFSHWLWIRCMETPFIIVILPQRYILYYLSSECIGSSAVQSFVRKLA